MVKTIKSKPILLVIIALLVFSCNDSDEEIIMQLQLGDTKNFFIYESMCFGDDYLISAYAQLDEIDTNHLFGVVINTYLVSRCNVRTQVQLSSTATATLGEHWVHLKFFYTYYDDFFEERRYGTKIVAIKITINESSS